ncbi:MAG: sensor histidine kinase [Dermatophilaceae bacterium]
MSGDRGTPQHRVLARLRRRLIATMVVVVTLGVGSACALLVARDVTLSRERADSDLLGAASRTAALVYVGDDGRPRTDAVADDTVALGDLRVVVVSRGPSGPDVARPPGVLFDSAQPGPGPLEDPLLDLVGRAAADAAEVGSLDDVRTSTGTVRAAALPWFDESGVAGAAIALEPRPRRLTSPLLTPILAVGVGLVVAFVALGAVLTTRSLRPAARAASERERFLATAAHELRSPLAGLRAGAEALGRAHPPGSAGWASARAVLHQADTASSVVGNLLLASRIDNADVPFAAHPVRLDTLASGLEARYPDVVAEVHEPVVVEGDEALLTHAVANLVDNARRHGGTADAVRVTVARTGGEVVFTVSDRGPGFPAGLDALAPYAGTGEGTGLGLSLVDWVVRRHHGRLELGTGAGGTGAEVRIHLPAANDIREGG